MTDQRRDGAIRELQRVAIEPALYFGSDGEPLGVVRLQTVQYLLAELSRLSTVEQGLREALRAEHVRASCVEADYQARIRELLSEMNDMRTTRPEFRDEGAIAEAMGRAESRLPAPPEALSEQEER